VSGVRVKDVRVKVSREVTRTGVRLWTIMHGYEALTKVQRSPSSRGYLLSPCP
jgi:hypothetical protein